MYKDKTRVVCVTSAVSEAGKTTIASLLLFDLKDRPRRGRGWAAIKLTTCESPDEHECPKGHPCGVCALLKNEFDIEEDAEVLKEEGKDTARLLKAGAEKVLWVKALPEAAKKALDAALSRLEGFEGVIIEGNHALSSLDADMAVMVLSPDGRFKDSARGVIFKVDAFLVNTNFGRKKNVLKRQQAELPRDKKIFAFDFFSKSEFESSDFMEFFNSACPK